MITLDDGVSPIDIDRDLLWVDEFDWVAVGQAMEHSITGVPLIDVGARTAGRPITLQAGDQASGWMSRSTVQALHASASLPGAILDLTLHGVTYSVVWRTHEGAPISAEPVAAFSDPAADDWYRATLRFMTV